MSNKEFQRNKACTFYGEWEQDAEMIKEDYGLEGKGLVVSLSCLNCGASCDFYEGEEE